MNTFKGALGAKAEFDGEVITITKRGQTRTFYLDEVTTILTAGGRFEFGLKGEETANSRRLSWSQSKSDVHNSRVVTFMNRKKKNQEAEEFLNVIRAAQRAARS